MSHDYQILNRNKMALDQKDIELLEKLMYKNSDDVAVSISRSFERLESRIEAVESRISCRIADTEDKLEGVRQDLADELGDVKNEVRDVLRLRDRMEMF
jgi:hypothetical protein